MKNVKRHICILFLLLHTLGYSQHFTVSCRVQDVTTGEPVKNVAMRLRYYCYNAKTKTEAYDTLKSTTDANGLVSFATSTKPPLLVGRFFLETADPKYRRDSYPLGLIDSARTIRYYLYAAGATDYFQDFYFAPNSSAPTDTNLFYQWKLNILQTVNPTIVIKAYYAPGEDKKLAQQRAEAVLKGFVGRGANARSFIIEPQKINEFKLSRDEHVNGQSPEGFFAKGTLMNEAYIKTLKGKRKEAACQLMRTVQLSRY